MSSIESKDVRERKIIIDISGTGAHIGKTHLGVWIAHAIQAAGLPCSFVNNEDRVESLVAQAAGVDFGYFKPGDLANKGVAVQVNDLVKGLKRPHGIITFDTDGNPHGTYIPAPTEEPAAPLSRQVTSVLEAAKTMLAERCIDPTNPFGTDQVFALMRNIDGLLPLMPPRPVLNLETPPGVEPLKLYSGPEEQHKVEEWSEDKVAIVRLKAFLADARILFEKIGSPEAAKTIAKMHDNLGGPKESRKIQNHSAFGSCVASSIPLLTDDNMVVLKMARDALRDPSAVERQDLEEIIDGLNEIVGTEE